MRANDAQNWTRTKGAKGLDTHPFRWIEAVIRGSHSSRFWNASHPARPAVTLAGTFGHGDGAHDPSSLLLLFVCELPTPIATARNTTSLFLDSQVEE